MGRSDAFQRATDELSQSVQVGAHLGNLQVGWMNGRDPVTGSCQRHDHVGIFIDISTVICIHLVALIFVC